MEGRLDANGEPPARLLVVEDDTTIAQVAARYLMRAGYQVQIVDNGLDAMAHAQAHPPDLVVLDLMLPGIDGLEVCRRLRALGPIPIVMVTARSGEDDRIIGLELGADDYISKPFSPRELVARVEAVLRRVKAPAVATNGGPTRLSAGDLEIDTAAHEVRRRGELLALTLLEFDLLVFLMRHPRQVLGRQQLLEHVWGYNWGDDSTVTVHVRRLRAKVEDDPSKPRHVCTVWGVGYRFDP